MNLYAWDWSAICCLSSVIHTSKGSSTFTPLPSVRIQNIKRHQSTRARFPQLHATKLEFGNCEIWNEFMNFKSISDQRTVTSPASYIGSQWLAIMYFCYKVCIASVFYIVMLSLNRNCLDEIGVFQSTLILLFPTSNCFIYFIEQCRYQYSVQ